MMKNIYRLLAVLCVVSLLLVGAASPASATPWQAKVDPWVLQTAAAGQTEFLVYLTTQADLSAAKALPTKLEKGRYVYQALTSTAERTQGALIATLNSLGVEYRSYWIANMLWVKAGLSTIQSLAERADVAHLYANPAVKLDAPIIDASASSQPNTIEWNIIKVRAPEVWALGFTGQGVVIGGQDTGYQWDHPALKNQSRGWNGSVADHDYNWHDSIHDDPYNLCGSDSPFPCDDYGHGTHTMGTMVGDDGGSNQIGMAPGARWIGCRNMDSGVGTPLTYTECYEWFVAPTRIDGSDANPDMAPDVINNSWGCPTSEGCNPDSLLIPVQNLVLAGIVTAHSAGNDGYYGCGTVNTPGAIYEESFTVGATDSGDQIAGFSSLGPVTVDGSGRPKPDISAPGVNIRSSVPGNGYQGGWDGTSMAGPHVAGLVALLISAHPNLRGQVDEIESVIEQNAVHIPLTVCSSSGVPNNAYGWGRIDALAAVGVPHALELSKTASSAMVIPGDPITYTLTVLHSAGNGSTTNVVLTDTLPTSTTFISATQPYTLTGNVVQWGFAALDEQQTVTRTLSVQVDLAATGSVTNQDYAVHSDQVEMVRGAPVSTQLEKPNFLALSKSASAGMVFPGDLLTYTIMVTNTHASLDTTNLVLTDTIPVGTVFVSASGAYTLTGDILRWDMPVLAASATGSVDLVVRVNRHASGAITNSGYAAYSDQAALVSGSPVSTTVGKLFFLPVALKTQ